MKKVHTVKSQNEACQIFKNKLICTQVQVPLSPTTEELTPAYFVEKLKKFNPEAHQLKYTESESNFQPCVCQKIKHNYILIIFIALSQVYCYVQVGFALYSYMVYSESIVYLCTYLLATTISWPCGCPFYGPSTTDRRHFLVKR